MNDLVAALFLNNSVIFFFSSRKRTEKNKARLGPLYIKKKKILSFLAVHLSFKKDGSKELRINERDFLLLSKVK